jgi:phosphatidylserine/phosphatidylglycerophosphate/cardiolipin synthase-like enzyme/uncharacterized membrane protein YdjX (TVP38/TMEM64 family)
MERPQSIRRPILTPGRNCWRTECASRIAFLVDGEAYFRAFRTAVSQAKHSVFILGWDIDTRLLLIRDGVSDGLPERLGQFLLAVLAQQRKLHIYVLAWDFHMIYAFEREWMSRYKLGWQRRFHFQMDGDHPLVACHHQKIVVVDDAVAFVGGLDLTKCRWDTPEHRPGNPRRSDLDEDSCPPFHDVQMMVDGRAAAALGDLARERWFRATLERVPAPNYPFPNDPWPSYVAPDMQHVQVAIARTEPRHFTRPEVREVERLYVDAIKAARRFLYIETQYLTSTVVGEALAEALERSVGPEIVIILHPNSSGWLEQHTMDILRSRLLARLRRADRNRRLEIYYPHIPGSEERCLTVHSKVLIVDDDLVRVGSANLSNRSMGVDTECDLAIDAQGDPSVQQAIADFRNRLLSEHLGVSQETVAKQFVHQGSRLAAVEGLRTEARTLRVFDDRHPAKPDSRIADAEMIDPDQPVDPDLMAERIIPREVRKSARRRILVGVSLLLILLSLAAAWRWTPLREWLDVPMLVAHIAAFKSSPAAPVYVIGGYLIGGIAVVPVTVLIVATVLAFGPALGFVYSLAGMTLSALATYGLGYLLGRDLVRRLAGVRLSRLSRQVAQRGLLTVVAIRVVPVAPFTIVNLIAGASPIRFRDFFLGTIIGELPGLTAMTLFVDKAEATVRDPGPVSFLVLAAAGGALVLGMLALRRWLGRKTSAQRPTDSGSS